MVSLNFWFYVGTADSNPKPLLNPRAERSGHFVLLVLRGKLYSPLLPYCQPVSCVK